MTGTRKEVLVPDTGPRYRQASQARPRLGDESRRHSDGRPLESRRINTSNATAGVSRHRRRQRIPWGDADRNHRRRAGLWKAAPQWQVTCACVSSATPSSLVLAIPSIWGGSVGWCPAAGSRSTADGVQPRRAARDQRRAAGALACGRSRRSRPEGGLAGGCQSSADADGDVVHRGELRIGRRDLSGSGRPAAGRSGLLGRPSPTGRANAVFAGAGTDGRSHG
jgi:hypothetical protein